MKSIKLTLLSLCILSIAVCQQSGRMPTVGIISASNEYVSHITMNSYKKFLEDSLHLKVILLQGSGPVNEKDEFSALEGTGRLKDCDLLLVFARRTTIAGKALADLKHFVASGKPVVALRTSSHGFQGWPEFDKEVLGGSYSGHYIGEPEKREIGPDGLRFLVGETTGPTQSVTINPENKDHPILKGVSNFTSKYSLYKTSPVAADAAILLMGTTAEGSEPVAWTRKHKGAKVVYIALGGAQDWKNPQFTRLVTNALVWAGDINLNTRK